MWQALAFLLFFLIASDGFTAPPTPFGKLVQGKYQVGYTTRIELDATRAYGLSHLCGAGCQKMPRPIVLAIWYPAQAAADAPALRYGDYLDVPAPNAELRPFATRLSRYNRETVIRYALEQSPEVPLSAANQEKLRRLLAMPMAAVQDAKPAVGPFPLILYHPGLGASLEDNATLAEYLASHGYLVVASAFQADDATMMNINWDLERSKFDFAFILRTMLAWSQVDGTHIAVMGQSYGAQAAMAFAMINRAVSAVVSIDSTLENATPNHEFIRSAGVSYNFARKSELRIPLLAFATHDQGWWFLDGFKYSDRYEIVLAGIDHSDSTSQGQWGRLVAPETREPLASGDPPPRLQYERLCESVRRFFDALLRKAPGARFDEAGAPGFLFHHKSALPPPPYGSELAAWVLEQGSEPASRRCVALRRADRNACDARTLQEAANYLEAQNHSIEALSLLGDAVKLLPNEAGLWDALGCALLRNGAQDKAIGAFQKGLTLNAPSYMKNQLKKHLEFFGTKSQTKRQK